MILKTMKVANWDIWFKQANSCSSHEVVHWRIWTIKDDLNLLALLVELDLLTWINGIILEVEIDILESLVDWHTSIEIDWRLQDTVMDSIFFIISQ